MVAHACGRREKTHMHARMPVLTTTAPINMAEPEVNGEQGLDLAETRKVLLSNSTKRRVVELQSLNEQLAGTGR